MRHYEHKLATIKFLPLLLFRRRANGIKQTIQTKQVRFEYKNFVMLSDDGYLYFIDPNCGSKYIGQNKASKNLCACCY